MALVAQAFELHVGDSALGDLHGRINVPTGYTEFPREILRPPRVSAERVFNIRRWTVMQKGGHFAALEQPRPLAEEIRAFFRALR